MRTSIDLGPWAQIKDGLLRIAGRDLPAGQQIAHRSHTPTREPGNPHKEKASIQATAPDMDDPGLILPKLKLSRPAQLEAIAQPDKRPAFAQLDEEQRWVYLNWLTQRGRPPGLGYAYLYLYGLEAGLFDSRAVECCAEIQRLFPLCQEPAFQAQAAFDLALGAWLVEKADLFNWAIERAARSAPYASALLWMQTTLGLNITPQQLVSLAPTCGYTPTSRNLDLLAKYVQVGLKTFEENTGVPWLAHFAGGLPDPGRPTEIRLANPAARFEMRVADLASHAPFRQAVSELVALADREASGAHTIAPEADQAGSAPGGRPGRDWYVALEFGELPSDQFEQALAMAQRQLGYSKLLDEKRNLVYRVIFHHRDLGQFWKLLDKVRRWQSTRVYVNGEARDPKKLWPHTKLE